VPPSAGPGPVIEWVRAGSYDACCLDFGGTLFDFAPVHVAAFKYAVGALGHDWSPSAAPPIIHEALDRGVDSVAMAASLVEALGIDADPFELARVKRGIVERLIAGSLLDPAMCALLTSLHACVRLAVVTRGLASSTRDILERSLPSGLAANVRVYGRSDLRARPDKRGLLGAAIADLGAAADRVVYIADAQGDAAIAADLGLGFLCFRPFA
jgi:beta-phosphoglucomutase-like phosphatase (HAD superfamily)